MRSSNPFGTCQKCRRRVMWIRTVAGKNMPVNPEMLSYRRPAEGEKGKEKIVTPNGAVVTGVTGVEPGEADGFGYISHFATCPMARNFRKR